MILNLISLFGGFLFSSIIDTSLGEFSEWAIVGAALVVANIETFNHFYYSIAILLVVAVVSETRVQHRCLRCSPPFVAKFASLCWS